MKLGLLYGSMKRMQRTLASTLVRSCVQESADAMHNSVCDRARFGGAFLDAHSVFLDEVWAASPTPSPADQMRDGLPNHTESLGPLAR